MELQSGRGRHHPAHITNASGKVVYTGAGSTTAGNNTFNWNGEDNSGNQLTDGSYKLAVKASAGGQTVTTACRQRSGTVSQIEHDQWHAQ